MIQPRNQGCMRKSPCDAMGCGKAEKWDPCCIETKPVDEMKLGMGYVPWQKFEQVMCAEQGLAHGTIFEELVLPFYGTACWNERGMKCR